MSEKPSTPDYSILNEVFALMGDTELAETYRALLIRNETGKEVAEDFRNFLKGKFNPDGNDDRTPRNAITPNDVREAGYPKLFEAMMIPGEM